jgi:hypothetical protein
MSRAVTIQNVINWNIEARERCKDPARKRRLQQTIDNLNAELRSLKDA